MKQIQILFLLLLLIACNNDNKHQKVIKNGFENTILESYTNSKGIKLNYTLGIDSTIFYNITSLFPENENSILVLDKGINIIYRINNSKEIVKSYNINTEIINSATFIAKTKEFIFVTEQYSPRIHLFDEKLNYVKEAVLGLICNDIYVEDNNVFVTGVPIINNGAVEIGKIMSNNFHYSPFNFSITLPTSISNQIKELKVKYVWKFGNIAANNDHVYFLSIYQNSLKIINDSIVTLNKKISSFPELAEILPSKYLYLPEEKIFNDIAVDSYKNAYILVGAYSEYPNRIILKLNKEGNLINEFILPHQSRSIYMLNDSSIFSIDYSKVYIHSYTINSK